MDDKNTIQELQKENKKLRAKVNSFEKSKERTSKTRLFIAQKLGGFFLLGPRLKESLTKIQEGDLSKDNISEVIIAVLYRFTRIGLFAAVAVLVPIVLLFQQNTLLSRQNDKIDKQNIRLDQQTSLIEADRRSAVILESGNVLDAVSRELENRKDSSLSDPLIGRIIALSRAMKEYKYLDQGSDALIGKALSPERAHLLVSLHNSQLTSTTYWKINQGANFSYAELQGAILLKANLQNANLQGANLQGAKLPKAMLQWTNLQEADLQGANLRAADLQEADLQGANLQAADLQEARLLRTNLDGACLIRAQLDQADLHFAKLRGTKLQEANLFGANLRTAELIGANLYGADLRMANLIWADLSGANLFGADLSGARAYKIQIRDFIASSADTTGMEWD